MGVTWSSTPRQRHLVLFAYEAWDYNAVVLVAGHMRPLCNFAARVVKMEPTIIVTLFTTSTFYDRVQTELKRNFEDRENPLLERIRTIALPQDATNPLDSTALPNAFADAYEKLVNLQPVRCVKTETEIETTCSPDVVLVDFFGSAPIDAVRRTSKKPVKVFFWFAGSATSLFSVSGPERHGGKGDLRARSQELAKLTSVSIDEAAGQISLNGKGTLIRMPGLPPMYDYEIQTQRPLGPLALLGGVNLRTYDTIAGCDGLILAGPECYEPEAVAALRDWFAESSRPVYACGPLIPHGPQAVSFERQQSPEAAKIEGFLDAMLASHGDNSVIYVSFGTIFFPMEPQKLAAFLDVAMEKKIPFILNHTSPYIPLPDFVTDKLRSYADCMVTKWCPQQLVLSHSATGFFVTHGGHNSVTEATAEGIPLICWPFTMDQATNAARINDKLHIGYELFQVRNGPGSQPAYRLGKAPECTLEAFIAEAQQVLSKAFGNDGMRKISNAQKLQQQISQAWGENGSSRKALDDFVASIGDSESSQGLFSPMTAWL
ncbi:glycosyltransferase family 1 protein [Daedalea quercina L-15889]|uniref:Glycosyltransferase family 1 protein n=1 Tax=Daedalea quercina L-15889 TaxID=1314783 RepID=A0A165SS50_9APHY|nr:glycosyltransferase family 1 protein [Daedalea quercina L-15889]